METNGPRVDPSVLVTGMTDQSMRSCEVVEALTRAGVPMDMLTLQGLHLLASHLEGALGCDCVMEEP